jgi:hypothetical protein
MKHSPATRGGIALALLLAGAAEGRADLIHWTYSWSNSPAAVTADSPGTSYITLSDAVTKEAVGDTDIVATNLRVHSTAPRSQPDVFTDKGYTLTLKLTDEASGRSGQLVFTGAFNGKASAANDTITNTFTGPVTQSLVLGDHVYTVTIGAYTAPGPPGAANAGSIGAHALVVINTLPEPGALTLAGLGVSFLGVTVRRRRGAALALPPTGRPQ